MRKVIRDGKVAVLVSPQFGAGWYSWNREKPECLFCPEIVELVEGKAHWKDIREKAGEMLGEDFYSGGAEDLVIEWVPEGTRFFIDEYDGSETLCDITPDFGIIA